MRLVVDMQGAQTESRYRGIGRYALAFAQALARNRGEHQILLALSDLFPETVEPIRAAFHGLLPQHDIHVWTAPGPVRAADADNDARRSVAELIREGFLQSLEPDVVHITNFFEGFTDDAVVSIGRFDLDTPVSVSLYDLIPLAHPRIYLSGNPRYEGHYRRRVEELAQAALLLAISESSRREALEHLGRHDTEVLNVSTAVGEQFRPLVIPPSAGRMLRRQLGIAGEFVLYTGGADERKNLHRLIDAFARLPRRLQASVQLVLAGMMPAASVDELRRAATDAGLPAQALVFPGYVSDDTLVALYNLCRAFVFPSWHEGFGLPVLEAMRCGAPTLGANASSIPEVIGLAEALFDPCDVSSMAAALARVLEDGAFRSRLSTHGRRQAGRFCWDRTAGAALAAFERLLASRTGRAARRPLDALVPRLTDAVALCCPADPAPEDLAALCRAMARIRGRDEPQQLLVDVSELSQRDAGTGIQRVTRGILLALLKQPPAGFVVKPVYGTLTFPGYRYANDFAARLGAGIQAEEDLPLDYGAGDVFLGLDLQHDVVRAQQSRLEDLRRAGVLVVFVVYDLLPMTLPEAFPPGAGDGHRAWLKVIARFDGALCISRAVARELENWLRDDSPPRLRPLAVRSFPMGADVRQASFTAHVPEAAPATAAALTAAARAPTFLTVGTLEPRKGHAQILDAFERLWASGVEANLVIVGRQGWQVAALCDRLRTHAEADRRLFWLDGISDGCLEQLYRQCRCLLAASHGEGFGLPLIEAARCGLPVIARDIPIFREVAGDHASYFTGNGAEDLAEAIDTWLALERDGARPRAEPMRLMTWQESASRLMDAVLELRDEGARSPEQANGARAHQ